MIRIVYVYMCVFVACQRYQESPPTATASDGENAEFLRALRSSIRIFVNRMKSDHSRGRSITNDSAVQGLFMTISQMHPQLLRCVQEQEELRSKCVQEQEDLRSR